MAQSLNRVLIIGNVGNPPESRYTPQGKAVVTFSVATNHSRQDASGNWIDEAEWHRVVAWERQAEYVQQYVAKGRQVFVEGRLQTRKWTDANGQQRYTTEIVASRIIGLGKIVEGEFEDEGQRPERARQSTAESAWGEDFEDVPFD